MQEADAGLYRCTGRDPYGRASYEDLVLEVVPGKQLCKMETYLCSSDVPIDFKLNLYIYFLPNPITLKVKL